MIFYGDGVVWDASLQKELCQFERRWTDDGKRLPGIYETDDYEIITKLRAAGYEGEGEEPEMPEMPKEEKKPEVKEEKKPEAKKEEKKEESESEAKKEEKPEKVEFPEPRSFGNLSKDK
jgi:hypothetical protein